MATGAAQSYFGHDEFKPHAPGLKSIDDALEIRRRVLLAFEEAEWEADPASRRAKLTFVVVGGGPTGVELSGAIMDVASQTLPADFRNVDTKTARVILVDGGPRLMGPMPEDLAQKAQQVLERMGVEIRLNSIVTNVSDQGVTLGDEFLPAENVLWASRRARARSGQDSGEPKPTAPGASLSDPTCRLPDIPRFLSSVMPRKQ